MIVPSNAIDEYPLWSPDMRYIVEGPDYTTLRPEDVDSYKAATNYGARAVTREDGLLVEMRETNLGVTFAFTKIGGAPITQWTSGIENCHSLSISPNGIFVAYLCEINGLFVTKLPTD